MIVLHIKLHLFVALQLCHLNTFFRQLVLTAPKHHHCAGGAACGVWDPGVSSHIKAMSLHGSVKRFILHLVENPSLSSLQFIFAHTLISMTPKTIVIPQKQKTKFVKDLKISVVTVTHKAQNIDISTRGQ